ncbi:ArsR/SmtB family transcription factor [Fodinicola feengrottensis]|uniref:Helix-turn-helix transcriptional regulator n=1 Tax=Fodinicola feengrottensis TaxID=435914 RepID=A0ABP4SJD6_9ACTN|nr:helix-turn-helix domain-containing protein [Fodinicola feengrottensis]
MSSDGRHPPIETVTLTDVFGALADPVRLLAVRTLAGLGSSPCNDLYRAAGLTIGRSTFSHHQKILREAGLIHERIDGARRILSIRTDDLDSRFPGLLAVIATETAPHDGTTTGRS